MKKTAAFVISLFILCAAAGAADIPGEEFDKLGGVAFNVPGQITGGLANLASANSNSFKITAGNESLCIEINGTSGTVTLDLGTFGPAKIAEMINIRARNGARAKEYLASDGNYKLAVFSMGLTDTLRMICGINTEVITSVQGINTPAGFMGCTLTGIMVYTDSACLTNTSPGSGSDGSGTITTPVFDRGLYSGIDSLNSFTITVSDSQTSGVCTIVYRVRHSTTIAGCQAASFTTLDTGNTTVLSNSSRYVQVRAYLTTGDSPNIYPYIDSMTLTSYAYDVHGNSVTYIFGFPTYVSSAIPARVEMMADGKPVGAGNPLPVIPADSGDPLPVIPVNTKSIPVRIGSDNTTPLPAGTNRIGALSETIVAIAQGIYTCTSAINTAEVCVVTCVFEVQGWNFVCNGTTANSYCLIYDSVSGTTETLYADGGSDYVALNINTLMQNPIFIINNASCTNVTFKIWGRIN